MIKLGYFCQSLASCIGFLLYAINMSAQPTSDERMESEAIASATGDGRLEVGVGVKQENEDSAPTQNSNQSLLARAGGT
jgi:hypothetical protein